MKTSSRKIRTTNDKSKGNKKAILGRLKHRNDVQANAQNRHDLRTGYQPRYVDGDRIDLNDVLIQPMGGAELKQICNSRRAQRDLQKRAKKDGKVGTTGLIAFGTEAQVWFGALDRATQNLAFKTIAEAICSRCNTTLTGLVVHRDESAVHAHFQMPSYDIDGNPLTKTMTWRDYGRLQDLVAETILEFEPRIERGNRKWDRIAAGALPSDTINRSVNRLHGSLLIELEQGELDLEDLHADRDEAQAELHTLRASVAALFAQREKVKERILKLREQETLSEQKAKNLRLYEGRLAKHDDELKTREARLQTLEAAVAVQKAEIEAIGVDAQVHASKIIDSAIEQQETLLQGLQMVSEGKLSIENGRWTAPHADPQLKARLSPLLKILRPLYLKVAELFARLTHEQERVKEERREVAAVKAKASAMIVDLEAMQDHLSAEQSEQLHRMRDELDLTP